MLFNVGLWYRFEVAVCMSDILCSIYNPLKARVSSRTEVIVHQVFVISEEWEVHPH